MSTIPVNDIRQRLDAQATILRETPNEVREKRLLACLLFPHDSTSVALAKMEYELDNGFRLELQQPRDISAKLHWLKLHYRNPIYPTLVDKLAVRDVIRERVGASYLADLYWAGSDPECIPWNELPQSFVAKATHGWNMNVFQTPEKPISIPEATRTFRSWLCQRHDLRHGEWSYSQVQPKIIVEELLRPSDTELQDYKFYCFDGEPRFLKVDGGRDGHRRQIHLSLECEPMPFHIRHYDPFDVPPPKPRTLDEMIEIARALARDIPFARVDLYSFDRRVAFGEITLYPCGGNLRFDPYEWSIAVGDMITLPSRQA